MAFVADRGFSVQSLIDENLLKTGCFYYTTGGLLKPRKLKKKVSSHNTDLGV